MVEREGDNSNGCRAPSKLMARAEVVGGREKAVRVGLGPGRSEGKWPNPAALPSPSVNSLTRTRRRSHGGLRSWRPLIDVGWLQRCYGDHLSQRWGERPESLDLGIGVPRFGGGRGVTTDVPSGENER